MDPFLYTFIGHRGMDHCNPLAATSVDDLIAGLDTPPGGLAADIGCGKGELLFRLHELLGLRAIGVDVSPHMIDDARRRAASRNPAAVFHQASGSGFQPPSPLAVAACLGASQAFHGVASAIARLAGWLAPGGYLILGEGYWRAEPSADFLARLGGSRDELPDEAGILALAASAGLTHIQTTRTSTAEFDRYEHAHAAAVESYAADHPVDAQAAAMLARRRAWTELYERGGRDFIGFGLFLFRR
jgi:SAM-dependent methyltransferase